MFDQKAKDLFARIGMEIPPVAVRFHFRRPEHIEQSKEVAAFCEFMKRAQEGARFFIAAENDNCCGKIPLGMAPKDAATVSGGVGEEMKLFRNSSPNLRLHNSYPTVNLGAINFVEFCPLADCDFDPDLVICIAATEEAQLIMRATSYISGDLWESKSSYVMSCAWTYAYPYLTGKVNTMITGMHHGLKRKKLYPAGRHIIAIPYQKLGEVVAALDEMVWIPPDLAEGASDEPYDHEAMLKKLGG